MIKKAGIVLLFLVIAFTVIGLSMTQEFNVEQTIEINAPAAAIHHYVNDLKQWPKWTPWQRNTAEVKIFYGNITRGVGASQSWKDSHTSGRLKITVSSPQNGIAYDIYFADNKTPSICAIQYHPLDSGITRVSWRMHGEINVPVIGSYIAIFVENITSGNYRTGLLKLKKLVESNLNK